MAKKDYNNWPKDKLIHEIKTLLKRKKFGLVWEDKEEEVAKKCEDFLPVLSEVKKNKIQNDKSDLQHIMIEGDNYHALSTLCYTHKKKIDVIYIDPPYNTGNKSWIYNNNYVEKDDKFPHSKWLSFMQKRLVLAKKLLTDDGFMVISIDHNELFYLGAICNEIFGEKNRLGVVTVLHNPKGRNLAKFFSENSEFMLVYAKNILSAKFNNVAIDDEVEKSFNLKDNDGNYRIESFMRVRSSWSRTVKPKNYYPIYVSKDLKTLTLEKKKGYSEIFPKKEDGGEWAWKNIPESFENLNTNEYFCAKLENNKIVIYHKYREQQVFKNVWTDKKYQSEFHGTNLLKNILGEKTFDYPKSLYLISDILKMTTKKDSLILDFFAGSGTTGHAVLELNKKDNGSRQFILCTNNENNNSNSSGGVAEGVCYPRIEKIMNGYTNSKKQKIDGLGGNLCYYKTDFVNQVLTDADKRKLVNKSTEMLCLTENAFDKILEEKGFYAVFENSEKMTGIIYDEDAIDDFNKAIKKLKKPLTIYVFSYDHTYNEEDFESISNLVDVKPIPEVILNVYRKIYKNIRKLKRL